MRSSLCNRLCKHLCNRLCFSLSPFSHSLNKHFWSISSMAHRLSPRPQRPLSDDCPLGGGLVWLSSDLAEETSPQWPRFWGRIPMAGQCFSGPLGFTPLSAFFFLNSKWLFSSPSSSHQHISTFFHPTHRCELWQTLYSRWNKWTLLLNTFSLYKLFFCE